MNGCSIGVTHSSSNSLFLCALVCVHRRVVEGSGVGIVLHGCVVHVDEKLCMVNCNLIATKPGRCGLSCMQKLWSA